MKQLILASSNPGKLREFAQMFVPLGIELIAQSALGIADADEPHETFLENARAKARHASRQGKLPAMADDSGICVRALDGQPGVHSARFADGPGSDERASQDALNNEKLLAMLHGKPDRSAHYSCVIVLCRHAADPEPLVAHGTWQGRIVDVPRGANGFGYDPYFLLPDLGMTAAELDPAQKNLLSHRGKALRRLLAQLKAGA